MIEDPCAFTRTHLFLCNKCFNELKERFIALSASKAGSTLSKKKSKAARINGKLGGRPKKS